MNDGWIKFDDEIGVADNDVDPMDRVNDKLVINDSEIESVFNVLQDVREMFDEEKVEKLPSDHSMKVSAIARPDKDISGSKNKYQPLYMKMFPSLHRHDMVSDGISENEKDELEKKGYIERLERKLKKVQSKAPNLKSIISHMETTVMKHRIDTNSYASKPVKNEEETSKLLDSMDETLLIISQEESVTRQESFWALHSIFQSVVAGCIFLCKCSCLRNSQQLIPNTTITTSNNTDHVLASSKIEMQTINIKRTE